MDNIRIILAISLFPVLVIAVKTPRTDVLKILKKYNASPAVEMQTTRTETKKTLGTTTISEGQLIYSNNKIYF